MAYNSEDYGVKIVVLNVKWIYHSKLTEDVCQGSEF